MFRIIVGVLAAFVGFSFGHSIPKWMETKNKPGADTQCSSSSSSSECAHPVVRKLLLRRKSVRRFKFGSQKPGKENLAVDQSLQRPFRDNAGVNGASSSPSSLSASIFALPEHKKSQLGTQKPLKGSMASENSDKDLDSSPNLPLSVVNMDSRSNQAHDASAAQFNKGRRLLQELCSKSNMSDCSQQKFCAQIASRDDSKLQEPGVCKVCLTQSMSGSPVIEKSQMKKWKMKLISLRSKAMASEKVWYEKFENEKYSENLLSPSLKAMANKQGKGKENESPQRSSTRKRELPWSRTSSSRIGLLMEDSNSNLER